MSKPIITKIEQKGYVDGSVVYENDARISAEIEGNVELSDVSEPKSSYNITVGPVYYGPELTTGSLAADWDTPDATILAFRVERTMTVVGLRADVNEVGTGGLADGDHELQIEVQYSKTSMLGAFGPGEDGDWIRDEDGPDITGVDASGEYPAGEIVDDKTYTVGTFVRVRIKNAHVSGADEGDRPQAFVTVTLTVAEEHVE